LLTLRLENLKNKRVSSNVLFEFDIDCNKLQESFLVLGLLPLFRSKNVIFEVLEVDRGSNKFFMTDSFRHSI
jgi:hypothetical protein